MDLPFTPLPQPPPTADLPATISAISSLTSFATSLLSSFPSSSASADLLPCPCNPHHLTPPAFLLRHSLRCPAAPGSPIPASLLPTPSPPTPPSRTHFPPTDLCLALDAPAPSFFYRDCPAVVTTPDPAPPQTFSLPALLSAHCAQPDDPHFSIQILPSELFTVQSETSAWNEIPTSYSLSVLRVAAMLHALDGERLRDWAIRSSARYGVFIDAEMGGHLVLLVRLCLKAVGKEARGLLESLDGGLVKRFGCPGLVASLTWLASQLAVLYGEASGRLLAIGMVREAMLITGESLLLIKPGGEGSERSVGAGDWEQGGEVFVSQVAAAVSALHERFLLEEKIKMLRFPRHVSKPQLLNEYLYASARGCEERKRRPNCRTVLEHDGLYWHRGQNEDESKTKTREELLAEERDYKRRRTSYRGKKLNRTPKEVIRDIIEEHMEQIKQAGGIGCNLKVGADTVVSPHEHNPQNGRAADVCERYDTQERRVDPVISKMSFRDEYSPTSSAHGSVSRNSRSSKTRDSWNSHGKLRYEHTEHWEDYKGSNHESGKLYESRGPSSHRSYSHSHSQKRKSHEEVDMEADKSKYERTDSWSKDDISRSTLTSISDNMNKDRGLTSGRHRSRSVMQKGFEDRYDPSDSQDGYGSSYDDASVGSSFLRSDKMRTIDAKHHDELPRHATSSHHRGRLKS